MSTAHDPIRQRVARALAFRHYRARILLAVVAAEAVFLLLIGALPVLHLVLPVVALPLLVPYLVFGRARLPDAEWREWALDDDAARPPSGCCRGTHWHLHGPGPDPIDEDGDVVLVATRADHGIRARRPFLVVETAGILLVVTPRSYWLRRGGDVRHGDASGIGVELLDTTDQVRLPRADDEVLGSTWLHVTKRGRPDLRYRDNPELYEVRRHLVVLAIGEERWAVMLYSADNAIAFGDALLAMTAPGSTFSLDDEGDDLDEDDAVDRDSEDGDADAGAHHDGDDDADVDDDEENGGDDEDEGVGAARPWHDVLAVPPTASAAEIKAAYRERLKEYHPDRVAHLGEKLRALATAEATAINAAYAEAMRLMQK